MPLVPKNNFSIQEALDLVAERLPDEDAMTELLEALHRGVLAAWIIDRSGRRVEVPPTVWRSQSPMVNLSVRDGRVMFPLAELRPLIVRASASAAVASLVRQVKNCYAFQQYEAAFTLCRVVIEASVRDICVKRNLFPELGDNVLLFEHRNWRQLRDKVSSGDLRTGLEDLYSRLCAVVHARKTVTREEARRTFEDTLRIIERLYEANEL